MITRAYEIRLIASSDCRFTVAIVQSVWESGKLTTRDCRVQLDTASPFDFARLAQVGVDELLQAVKQDL